MPEPQRDLRSTEAARRVFLELFQILKPYPGLAVLVGGLVPGLEYNDEKELHQGTLDVDLVVPRDKSKDPDLARLLKEHGYYQRGDYDEFQYFRRVIGFESPVRVDLLTERNHGEGTRLVSTHGALAFPLFGGELATQESHLRKFEGQLPDGGQVEVEARIAGVVPFVVLKAFAIRDRESDKEKDPYDLYYCIRHYPGGVKALIAEFHPFLGFPLVLEAAAILEEAFKTPESYGPACITGAAPLFPSIAPDQLGLDSSERVMALVRALGKPVGEEK
jgi:hypothetical protein